MTRSGPTCRIGVVTVSVRLVRLRYAFACVAACACLTFAGCSSDAEGPAPSDPAAADDTASATASGREQGQIPSNDPTDAGGGNGGSDTGENDSGGGGSGNGADSVEVAGPTLENDYPQHWGNIDLELRAMCANFVNQLNYNVTIESISVSTPLSLVTNCEPTGGEPPVAAGCAAGFVLVAQRATACNLGVEFAVGTDFAQNYLVQNDWRLSAVCTDATAEPCNTSEVAAAGPAPNTPVMIIWTLRQAVRFCGATGYSDDQGNPDGGGPPEDGCLAELAASSAPSSEE